MAVSYKGLTIKFGGDTTQLQAALKKIQTESRATQSDLKDINRALKFNPGNTELLEQKVRALNKAYNETKDRLAAYKSALAELDAKKQSGAQLTEQEQRQYDSLKRQIFQCENQLESYSRQMQTASRESEASKTALYKFGQQIDSNKDKLSKIGSVMEKAGKTVAGASAGIASASVTMASGFEDAMAKVSTIADTTEVPLDSLRKQILELSDSTGIAASDIAENVYNAISAGQNTGDAVAFVANATNLAKAGFTDSSSALDVLTTAMNAYKLSADDVSEVSDILLTTQNKGKTTVGELASSMGKAIPTAAAFNVDLRNLAAAYATTTANGIATAESTTYIKSMIKELGDTGSTVGSIIKEKTGKSFSELMAEGDSLGDVLNVLNGYGADTGKTMYDMFGSAEAASAAATIASGGAEQFSESLSAMAASSGATDDAMGKMQTSSSKAAKVLNRMKNDGIELGSSLIDLLSPSLDRVSTGVEAFSGWIKELSPEQRALFANVAVGAGAFGALSAGFGKALQSAAGLANGFKKLAGGWSALTGIISANPIGLGVAAVASAVAGLTWFFTQTEEGKQIWSGFTGWISEKWQAAQDFLGGIPEFWSGVADGASSSWEGMKSAAAEKFGAITSTIESDMQTGQTVASASSSALKDALSGDWDGATRNAAVAFNTIRDNIQSKMSNARENAINAGNAIGENLGFPGLGSAVANVFDSVRNNIISPIRDAWNFVSGIPGRIQSAFSNIRISLPHINLPHFNVSWNDTGGVVKLPSIGVEWYAKGGYFEQPSIIGVGEAGGEYVAPERQLQSFIERAVGNAFDRVRQPGQQINVAVEVNATVADKVDAYQTGQQIGEGIASKLKQRGVTVGA